MIGTTVGRYRILASLGRGGIATVWRAHDPILQRDVALKIINDDIAQSAKDRQRFLNEARTTAKLGDHPGIIAVYEQGDSGGHLFIAYSLIDGDTVSGLVGQRLMPIAEAVRIACAVADALQHAHAHGVIHRDVTGRNVMVARDGRVIMLDFGLALAAGVSRLTTTRTVMGTMAYMAPETVAGLSDERSDLYGLGILLYEMLTGRYPFVGSDATYQKLHQRPVPPRALRPEVPEALDRIVMHVLEPDPARRVATAAEMLAGLRDVSRGAGTSGPRPIDPVSAPDPSAEAADVTRPHPLYLAIPPFEVTGDPIEPALREQLARLSAPLNAMLARTEVRPVAIGAEVDVSGDARAVAAIVGANAVLRGCAMVAGSRLRVTWTVVDPRSGTQWAGDVVDGSTLMPFEVQDRLVSSVARGLGVHAPLPLEPDGPRPKDPAASDRMIQALRHLERYDHEPSVDGAIAILERLMSSEGESAPTLAALCRAYLYKRDLTREMAWIGKAASVCDRAVRIDPDAAEVKVALGDVHRAAGLLSEAVVDYEGALERAPDSIEARLGLSHAREDQGDDPGSIRECREALAIRPADWRIHFRLGGHLFTHGRYVESIAPIEQVVRLVPDNPRGWRLLGNAFFNLDRFDDAAAAYRRSLEIQPNAHAYNNLATVLYYMGQNDAAIEAFERATAMMPAYAIAWGNLGSACRWIPGHLDRARDALERAIALMREHLALDPADAEGWSWLAGWLSNLDRHEDALNASSRALELAPENVSVLSQAGQVYFHGGQRARALQLLRDAVHRGLGTMTLRRSPALAALRDDPEFLALLGEGEAKRNHPRTLSSTTGGPS